MTRSRPPALVLAASCVACALPCVFAGCTLFLAGVDPCDVDGDCDRGLTCVEGFCSDADGGEGEVAGEGEGDVGEGEGDEGEGDEGEGDEGEGDEGEGDEGEGEVGEGEGDEGEGEGEGDEGEGEGEGEGETVELCDQQHVVPPWFDAAFPARIPIAFCDVTAPNEAVVALPVTVILDDLVDLVLIDDDGRDVIFVDHRANGGAGALLPYERQIFDDLNVAVFHVRVPTFNPATGLDDIWMYVGSADGVERSDPVATYADYASVWHFDDNALLREAKTGAQTENHGATDTTGQFGEAIDTDGGDFAFLQNFSAGGAVGANAVTPPNPPTTSSQAAVSMFLSPDNTQNADVLFLSELDSQASGRFTNVAIHVSLNNGALAFFAPTAGGGAQFLLNGPAVPNGGFTHASASWSSAGASITLAGAPAASTTNAIVAGFPVENIVLGLSENGNNRYSGQVDELRISNLPRSDAFFRAEAKAYAGTLLEIGVIELGP